MSQRLVEMRWERLGTDLAGLVGWACPDSEAYTTLSGRVGVGWRRVVDALQAGDNLRANTTAKRIRDIVAKEAPAGGDYERLMVVLTFLNLGSLIGKGPMTVETPSARYTIR